MKHTIRIGLLVVGLAATLATTAAVAQGPGTSRANPPNDVRGEKEFRHAVQQIEHVRDELMHAPARDDRRMTGQARNERWPNDYAGHRSRAVDHLNMAIRELQGALATTTDPHDKKDDKKEKKDKK